MFIILYTVYCSHSTWTNTVSGDKSKFFSVLLAFFSAGSHGPRGWATSYPECAAKNQSPVDITDEQAVVSEEYQELMLEKFNAESSNQTTMKNTGKTGVHNILFENNCWRNQNMEM